jgi:hypothetical protein
MRKYVEFSHKELSKRLDLTATRADVGRLERTVDSRFDQADRRFDRLERKLDALATARRAPSRRRKP